MIYQVKCDICKNRKSLSICNLSVIYFLVGQSRYGQRSGRDLANGFVKNADVVPT